MVGEYAKPGQPFFVLAFGGLGLYGGHDDFFLFLRRVMYHLHAKPVGAAGPAGGRRYEAVGAQEMARLATEAGSLVLSSAPDVG